MTKPGACKKHSLSYLYYICIHRVLVLPPSKKDSAKLPKYSDIRTIGFAGIKVLAQIGKKKKTAACILATFRRRRAFFPFYLLDANYKIELNTAIVNLSITEQNFVSRVFNFEKNVSLQLKSYRKNISIVDF